MNKNNIFMHIKIIINEFCNLFLLLIIRSIYIIYFESHFLFSIIFDNKL